MRRLSRRVTPLILLITLSGCASSGPVTVENSYEGKVAVYAKKVVEATDTISTAVKNLEASGVLPTTEAAGVVRVARDIDDQAVKLADLLAAYDAINTGSPIPTDLQGRITESLNRIGTLAGTILVPISGEGARKQIADLVGALNQTIITLSLELAKGVK